MAEPQSFKNHTRWDPVFHFFIAPILLLNIVVAGKWYADHRYQHAHSGPWVVLVSVVMLLVALKMRNYAIKVQDRVIRLEERIRLAELLPESELRLIEVFSTHQLVALRFASDAELPALAARAALEKLTAKQIKQSIVTWRPDTERV